MSSSLMLCVLTDNLKLYESMVAGCSKFANVMLKMVDPVCRGIFDICMLVLCLGLCGADMHPQGKSKI